MNTMARDTNNSSCSLYPPAHAPGSQILLRIPDGEVTRMDRFLVMMSSLTVVGSVVWVPLAYTWAWKRWQRIPKQDRKRRTMYATFLLSLTAFVAVGPYRSHRLGRLFQIKKWRLWKAWLKFVAFEVIADDPASLKSFDVKNDQAIFAVSPHGIFPFALGFTTLTDVAKRVFGEFRPVVATATEMVPLLRTILAWINAVDASRQAVDRALAEGSRIGVAPGGIAEMYEGYPKPSAHPDEEYCVLKSRKGFVRMAVKHGVPVVPIYCFGATKMFKRLQLPEIVERLSKLFRISICVFFGSWGLPMPFRQRLLYVMGRPIHPPPVEGHVEGDTVFEGQVDAMHSQFCDELVALFDRHKESYGWARKTLRIV